MNAMAPSKTELIIAGVGGQGVLFAGEMLALAATRSYTHISYMPSYGTEKRGGHSECTVVLSADEIASPVLDQSQTVMLLDSGQASAYEDRVRPGGLMLVEQSGLTYQPQRSDIRFLPVSGLEIAVHSGGAMINNLIMLGVHTHLTQAVAADDIIAQLERQAGERAEILKRNKHAFASGLELGKNLGA